VGDFWDVLDFGDDEFVELVDVVGFDVCDYVVGVGDVFGECDVGDFSDCFGDCGGFVDFGLDEDVGLYYYCVF